MQIMTRTIKVAILGAFSALALGLAAPNDAAAERGYHKGDDRRDSGRYERGDRDRGGDRDYDRDRRYGKDRYRFDRSDHDRRDGRKGRDRYSNRWDNQGRYGHGGHKHKHKFKNNSRYDYGRYHDHRRHAGHGYARKCHKVYKHGRWHGRPARIGGTQCYDSYGRAYIVDDSRFLVNFLYLGLSAR